MTDPYRIVFPSETPLLAEIKRLEGELAAVRAERGEVQRNCNILNEMWVSAEKENNELKEALEELAVFPDAEWVRNRAKRALKIKIG